MKKQILVVGNEFDLQDNNSLKLVALIANQVPQVNFTSWDPTEELPNRLSKDIIIIDVVMGIKNIQVVTDLETFRFSPRNTVHDFDLPIALGLLKKIGKIDNVTIIGVPVADVSQEVQEDLITILKSI